MPDDRRPNPPGSPARGGEPSPAPSRPGPLFERLRALYAGPGPYVSIYHDCGDGASWHPDQWLTDHGDALLERGASRTALDSVAAALAAPLPADAGGVAVHVASDGSRLVDHAPEGPHRPYASVGALPVVGPLIEWEQWRVPHATVTLTTDAGDIALFLPRTEPQLVPTGGTAAEVAAHCRRLALELDLRLIVVAGGETATAPVSPRLTGVVPTRTRVVTLDAAASTDPDRYAEAVVRHVADVVARDSVEALEDFRFYQAGHRVAQGRKGAFDALASGSGERLFVHDDPTDPTMASFGVAARDVSADPARFPNRARSTDVAIWSAVCQEIEVRILPSTGDAGPADDIAVLLPRAASESGR